MTSAVIFSSWKLSFPVGNYIYQVGIRFI